MQHSSKACLTKVTENTGNVGVTFSETASYRLRNVCCLFKPSAKAVIILWAQSWTLDLQLTDLRGPALRQVSHVQIFSAAISLKLSVAASQRRLMPAGTQTASHRWAVWNHSDCSALELHHTSSCSSSHSGPALANSMEGNCRRQAAKGKRHTAADENRRGDEHRAGAGVSKKASAVIVVNEKHFASGAVHTSNHRAGRGSYTWMKGLKLRPFTPVVTRSLC